MFCSVYVPLQAKRWFWSIREQIKNGEVTWGRLTGGLNRRKNLKNKFCPKPWEDFDILDNGDVYVCCTGWLPKAIGNYKQSNIAEIWNSEEAQRIKRSILDGSFRYCNHDVCWHIQKGDLPDKNRLSQKHQKIVKEGITVLDQRPDRFSFVYDRSCNLSCPSCRKELIYYKDGVEYEQSLAIHKKLMADLFSAPHKDRIEIACTGSGDPFASPIFREFLFALNGSEFPNVVITLTTNGILFTEANWQRMRGVHNNIGHVIVSFDAATPETYAYTRRGGNFATLLKNFEFINKLRGDGYIKYLKMDFVVQQKNFMEMVDFVKLGKSFGHVDSIGFALITNWGTYPPKEFKYHAIWRKDHPELQAFLNVLKDPIFDDPIVDMKNLSAYRQVAKASV